MFVVGIMCNEFWTWIFFENFYSLHVWFLNFDSWLNCLLSQTIDESKLCNMFSITKHWWIWIMLLALCFLFTDWFCGVFVVHCNLSWFMCIVMCILEFQFHIFHLLQICTVACPNYWVVLVIYVILILQFCRLYIAVHHLQYCSIVDYRLQRIIYNIAVLVIMMEILSFFAV